MQKDKTEVSNEKVEERNNSLEKAKFAIIRERKETKKSLEKSKKGLWIK